MQHKWMKAQFLNIQSPLCIEFNTHQQWPPLNVSIDLNTWSHCNPKSCIHWLKVHPLCFPLSKVTSPHVQSPDFAAVFWVCLFVGLKRFVVCSKICPSMSLHMMNPTEGNIADVQDNHKWIGIPEANGNQEEVIRRTTTTRYLNRGRHVLKS